MKKTGNKPYPMVKIEADAVLDCLNYEIMIIDSDFRIIFANQALLDELGVTMEELRGRHCYAVTHHIDKPCEPPSDPCPIQKVKELKESSAELHTHFRKNGDKFLVNVIAAAINEKGGSDLFLHVDIPIKDESDKENDAQRAIGKTKQILKVVNLYQDKLEEMKNKTQEIESFNEIAINREVKMIELKNKIKELQEKLSKIEKSA